MSPRKARYRIPEWQVDDLRQRRKRILHGPYNCPRCNSNKLRIRIDKENRDVVAECECGLARSYTLISTYEPVDYYSKLIDEYQES